MRKRKKALFDRVIANGALRDYFGLNWFHFGCNSTLSWYSRVLAQTPVDLKNRHGYQ